MNIDTKASTKDFKSDDTMQTTNSTIKGHQRNLTTLMTLIMED